MKLLGLALLALVSFAAALVGMVAASGNLSKESIEQLIKKPEPQVVAEQAQDDVGPLARALREREQKLDERQRAVSEREARVSQMLAELDELRAEVLAIQKQIQAALDSEETDRQTRLEDVAKSLAEMKPTNAAQVLEDWPVEDAAEVLRLIKEKDRGKILDGMEPAKTAVLLRALQERKY